MALGAQCVMIVLVLKMQLFFADSWDLKHQVCTKINVVTNTCAFISTSCLLDAVAYGNAVYGQGTGPIWLEELGCGGSEDRIIDCSHPPLGTHNCDHIHDVGVICILRE